MQATHQIQELHNLGEALQQVMGYTPYDYVTIATLIVLEGLLSVDNALVLAALVRKLPEKQQQKALTYGIWGAVFFRIIALVVASIIIQNTWIKLIGGAYLIYLSFKHMFPATTKLVTKKGKKNNIPVSFWRIVILVELTDIVFSIDSITTAVAMTPKLTVIMIGGLAGIIVMRFVAVAFIKLLEKFPRIDDIAYQIIFFIGTKLTLESISPGFHIDERTFWLVIVFIVLVGFSVMYKERISDESRKEDTSSLITSQSEEYIIDIARERVSIVDLFESDNQFSADFIRYLIRNGYLAYTRKATLPRIKIASNSVYTHNNAELEEVEGKRATKTGKKDGIM